MHFSDNIRTLEELIEALDDCGGDKTAFAKVFHRLQLEDRAIEKYCHWIEDGYTRNCVHRSVEYELVVMCWGEDQVTDIHDHDGQDGWVYLVTGQVSEDRFVDHGHDKPPEFYSTTQMNPGDFASISDALGLHRMANTGSGRAVTLHLYAGPVDDCHVYDEKTGNTRKKELQFHSIEGEVIAEQNLY